MAWPRDQTYHAQRLLAGIIPHYSRRQRIISGEKAGTRSGQAGEQLTAPVDKPGENPTGLGITYPQTTTDGGQERDR